VRAGRFPCDCCGHWTLTAAPDGESLQLCAVCGWEDSEHWQRGEAALDLLVAQRAFVTDGVAVALFRDDVRPPTTDEQRDARWLPYDERARALLARVEATFADVRLGKGESPTEAIVQSRRTDNYGADDGTRPPPGLWHPVGAHGWSDVTPAGVDALCCGNGGLNFMDGRQFRFFLPVIARQYLDEQAVATRYHGSWLPLFHFADVDERRVRDHAGYAAPQRQWLAEFFAFATRPGSAASRRTVRARPERAAWRAYWRAQLPADYLDVYGDA